VTELFLIRHARAVDHAASDGERPLEAEGRRDARAVGQAMLKAAVEVDLIVTSPFVRAVETATLVAVELGYQRGLVVDASLTPDGSTSAILAFCAGLESERVALVGHEPSMGQLLSDLVGRPGMSMVKAGVACLSLDGGLRRGAARLRWTMSPRHLAPQRAG
jgi:phosphohistidine phosphatase